MTKQLDMLGVWPLPNVVGTDHEVLAVKPDSLLPINDLSLSKNSDKCKLLSCAWRTQVRSNVVGGFWRHCKWKRRGHNSLALIHLHVRCIIREPSHEFNAAKSLPFADQDIVAVAARGLRPNAALQWTVNQ
jgi:hypothetical protein